jgi:hypothetical protein
VAFVISMWRDNVRNILTPISADGTDGLTAIHTLRFGICAVDWSNEHRNSSSSRVSIHVSKPMYSIRSCAFEEPIWQGSWSRWESAGAADATHLLPRHCSHGVLSRNESCIAAPLALDF